MFLGYKIYSRGKGGLYVRSHQMDLTTGMRQFDLDELEASAPPEKTVGNLPLRVARGLF